MVLGSEGDLQHYEIEMSQERQRRSVSWPGSAPLVSSIPWTYPDFSPIRTHKSQAQNDKSSLDLSVPGRQVHPVTGLPQGYVCSHLAYGAHVWAKGRPHDRKWALGEGLPAPLGCVVRV